MSSDALSVDLGDLPPNVITEAHRVTALPAGPLQVAGAKKLIAKLRRSELRKVDALQAAIRHDARVRKYLKTRGKK